MVLVLGFLSAPRTLNGVAMVDRPHYHPHAPLLLTANLVCFFYHTGRVRERDYQRFLDSERAAAGGVMALGSDPE